MIIETAVIKPDQFYIKNGRILLDNREVGHFFFDGPVKNYDKSQLARDFQTQANFFTSWKLPAKFDYVFLSEWKLNANYRGRGFGGPILQSFFASFKRPTLIALQPGELTKQVKFESLVKFYKTQGMYVTRIDGDLFAFKWVTP